MQKNNHPTSIRITPVSHIELAYLMQKYGLSRASVIIRLIAQAYAVEKEREKMK